MRAACLVRTAIKQCRQELEDKEAREQATHSEHRTREPLDERSTRPEDDLDMQALSSSRMKTLIPSPSPATSCAQSKVSGSWDEKTMIDDHLDWNRRWSTNANKYRQGLRQRLDLAGERWGRGRSSASLELPIRTGIWGAHDTKRAFRKRNLLVLSFRHIPQEQRNLHWILELSLWAPEHLKPNRSPCSGDERHRTWTGCAFAVCLFLVGPIYPIRRRVDRGFRPVSMRKMLLFWLKHLDTTGPFSTTDF